MFLTAVFVVAVLSGATAALAGFGIGSLLTPLIALEIGTAAAVAVVAIPHAAATALRFFLMRGAVDRDVLKSFGLLSAAGGLVGALLYTHVSNAALTLLLAGLLIATSAATLADLASRWSPRGPLVGALGALSGLFGGLAGNQGGLRAAALLSFSLPPASYVATSTAIALMVDAVRTPVYVWQSASRLNEFWIPLLLAMVGVLTGTLLGERILLGLSPSQFRRIVASIIGGIGVLMLVRTLPDVL